MNVTPPPPPPPYYYYAAFNATCVKSTAKSGDLATIWGPVPPWPQRETATVYTAQESSAMLF